MPKLPAQAFLRSHERDSHELSDLEAATISMRAVTGAFADTSHESAFAAQLFCMTFPCHAFLMALTIAVCTWIALIASRELQCWYLSVVVLFSVGGLISRVLFHRMQDSVRGRQRICAVTWTILIVLIIVVAICAEAQLGSVLCLSGVAILASVVTHMAELDLRQSYAENLRDTKIMEVRINAQEKRQREERSQLQERLEESRQQKEVLEERNEQLQAEKERLLYDVQRRSRQFDDDDRSAIHRGLLAGPSQPCHLTSDTNLSGAGGGAASDSSPPSLPPGAPSSSGSSSTKPSHTRVEAGVASQGCAAQGAVAPSCPWPWENMDMEGLVLARTSQSSTISYEGVYASGDGFGAELRKGAKRLRQDGFRSPLEAAQERAQWLRSREEGKGHAPAVAATGQEQLAAEALIDLVAAKGAAMAPAVAQLLASVAAEHSTHKGLWPAREPAGFEGVCTSRASFDAELRTGGSSSSWDEQLVQAGAARVISEEPMLNRRGAAPEQEMGSSKASTLEERFAAHVMCNYTPSPPGKLSKKRWVSCEQLLRQLQPHTSSAETLWEPAYAKQLVCDRFKNHPTFAGRSFSEWCKRLLNRDVSGGRNHVTCFSLEYTPG